MSVLGPRWDGVGVVGLLPIFNSVVKKSSFVGFVNFQNFQNRTFIVRVLCTVNESGTQTKDTG